MPLVSIIIPTYKRDKSMLRKAIYSSLNQTYKYVEIIIVDDNELEAYSDEVKHLVEEINDSRISLVRNEKNLGGALSRNKGAALSKGDYISFLDDDDFYLKEKIEKQVTFIKARDYDFVVSNLAIINENYKLKDHRRHSWFKEGYDNNQLIIEHFKNHLTGTPTFLFKKDIFLNVGGFPDVNIGHEFFLVYEILMSNYKVGYLDKTLSVAIIHSGERVSNKKNRQEDLEKLLEFKLTKRKEMKKKDIKKILYRHYLTKSYAYMNSENKFTALYFLLLSFYKEPFSFFQEVKKRVKLKLGEML